MNVREGTRDHTGQAYLIPARERANLRIIERSLVSRIMFEKKESEICAIGVEYRDLDSGEIKSVLARKDVILCAGAYNSPQILMISGVGDAEQLKEMGITPIHHLPGVGRNLQDHPCSLLIYDFKKPELGFPIGDWSDSNEYAKKVKAEWEHTRRGKAGSNQMEVVLFTKTCPTIPYQNLQVHFIPGPRSEINANEINVASGLSISIDAIRPKSVGSLKVQSKNPEDAPLIVPMFLATKKI